MSLCHGRVGMLLRSTSKLGSLLLPLPFSWHHLLGPRSPSNALRQSVNVNGQGWGGQGWRTWDPARGQLLLLIYDAREHVMLPAVSVAQPSDRLTAHQHQPSSSSSSSSSSSAASDIIIGHHHRTSSSEIIIRNHHHHHHRHRRHHNRHHQTSTAS